jgi:hypothetical protein
MEPTSDFVLHFIDHYEIKIYINPQLLWIADKAVLGNNNTRWVILQKHNGWLAPLNLRPFLGLSRGKQQTHIPGVDCLLFTLTLSACRLLQR